MMFMNPVPLLCVNWACAQQIMYVMCCANEPRVRFVAVSGWVYLKAVIADRVGELPRFVILWNVGSEVGAVQ